MNIPIGIDVLREKRRDLWLEARGIARRVTEEGRLLTEGEDVLRQRLLTQLGQLDREIEYRLGLGPVTEHKGIAYRIRSMSPRELGA